MRLLESVGEAQYSEKLYGVPVDCFIVFQGLVTAHGDQTWF